MNKCNKLRDIEIAESAKQNKEHDNNTRFNVFADYVAVEEKNEDEVENIYIKMKMTK